MDCLGDAYRLKLLMSCGGNYVFCAFAPLEASPLGPKGVRIVFAENLSNQIVDGAIGYAYNMMRESVSVKVQADI